MAEQYVDIGGERIEIEELKIAKAKFFAVALDSGNLDFVELIECRKMNQSEEAIVFSIESGLSQIRINENIKRIERVAVVFENTNTKIPSVLALRMDFPITPHQNLTINETPRELCLYAIPYDEIKITWNPVQFLRRIQQWLKQTANGSLHQDDQPLEPFLFGTNEYVILPYNYFAKDFENKTLLLFGEKDGHAFIAKECNSPQYEKKTYAVSIIGKPQPHGVIKKQPSNLAELNTFLESADVKLLDTLRSELNRVMEDKPFPEIYKAPLILIICLPKTRQKDSSVESLETWAFWANSIEQIGVDIGIWQIVGGSNIGRLITIDESKNGNGTEIKTLRVIYSLSKDSASKMNGLSESSEINITQIGVGALGSQLFMNLVRLGFGKWTLIDNDDLLPHNLSRHYLAGNAIGLNKAYCISELANATLDGDPISNYINTNILHPGEAENEVDQSLKQSDIILDITTSIAVERYIANDIESDARRISMFLNPRGTDAVMLAEDRRRNHSLDFLEMQYYRYLIENEMENHLNAPEGKIRYSNSCGDVSTTISQENVAMYAAILSRSFRESVEADGSNISIWTSDGLNVKHIRVKSDEVLKCRDGSWDIHTDELFLNKIMTLREQKLPNETGGILIGAIDTSRNIIYVVDTIPSPPDSKEWPTVYIRGYKGLKKELERIQKITDYRLGYIGEWHSHPKGHNCRPSSDDKLAFEWLREQMLADGYPAIMMIMADDCAFYIEHM